MGRVLWAAQAIRPDFRTSDAVLRKLKASAGAPRPEAQDAWLREIRALLDKRAEEHPRAVARLAATLKLGAPPGSSASTNATSECRPVGK